MDWSFPVAEKWYSLISNGSKKIEGRVPDVSKPSKNYSNLQVGDIAIISAVDSNYKSLENLPEIRFQICANRRYPSVRDMLESEGLENVIPGVESIEEGIAIYHAFPGYEGRIKISGIYAIGLGERV